MRIGFDLDGVLCEIDVAVLRIIDNSPEEARKSAEEWYYRERKPLLNMKLVIAKGDECFILTSRPNRLAYITVPWVKRYYPNIPLTIISHETLKGNSKKEVKKWLVEMGKKKAEVINAMNLDIYFEDSPTTVHTLRKFCPNTKIIQYGGRW